MICLSLDIIQKTLIPRNKDPKESEATYMEEMRREWRKVQKEAGRQFVKLAKRREELQLRRREEEWWEEVRDLRSKIGGRMGLGVWPYEERRTI